MSEPVAIVTGAASGIGLALTKHLLTRGFRVAMADVNAAAGKTISGELGSKTIFEAVDVSDYARQVEWGGNRLDFFAANAGIDDRQSLHQKEEQLDKDGIPKPLNTKTLDVDLLAVVQGIWLFKHYARKNKVAGGKALMTASAAGIYPMLTNPQYTVAKHGLVGLTRSCGPGFAKEGIFINCIMPAFVPTGLCPPHVLDIFPKEHITPMSIILKAYDKFLDGEMSGQTVEVTLDELHFRTQPEYPNESQRWMGEDAGGFWAEAYKSSAIQRPKQDLRRLKLKSNRTKVEATNEVIGVMIMIGHPIRSSSSASATNQSLAHWIWTLLLSNMFRPAAVALELWLLRYSSA